MKRHSIVLTILLTSLLLVGCKNKTPSSSEEEKITGTIWERLRQLDRVSDIKGLSNSDDYNVVIQCNFDQYIDHNNKDLGTFKQQIQIGFKGFDAPNVLVTEGYMIQGNYSSWKTGENELGFLLNGNYCFIEHRYFGSSLPVAINYNDADTWKYLTTEQAAADIHDIVHEMKRIVDGKWIATGMSKGGMTTELYNYYFPGDMDLYVPYVAPFCNSFSDKRMVQFLNEDTGDLQYGETRAKEIRDEVLEFQLKLLEYRDTLAPKFYQAGVSSHCTYTDYVTADLLYDAAVLEFGIGFWQYYQQYSKLEKCLALPETSAKVNSCYSFMTSVIAPDDLSADNEFTPYYIQAYKELGNYGYDFHYIRNAGGNLVVTEQQESELMWNLCLTTTEQSIGHGELVNPKINNMLATTDQNFIIIYGSSDPWYAVRPTDVTGRDNINIYVNDNYPHTSNIANFDAAVKDEILAKINSYLA